ncbi:MAG: class I SAM-dependent methyltransferase, partial [Candidatus Binatia bacterium]
MEQEILPECSQRSSTALTPSDVSLPMIQHGKSLPAGHATNINWMHDSAESFNGQGPYSLVTAGQSLHWLKLDVVLPKLSRMLTPDGVLAIVDVLFEPQPPWQEGYSHIIKRYSNNQAYQPINIVSKMQEAGLFQTLGMRRTAPLLKKQRVADYIDAQHARSSLSLDTMSKNEAEGFMSEMRSLLER